MILFLGGDDVPDLTGEVSRPGAGGVGPGEIAVAIPEEQVAETAVQATELGKKAELVAAQEEVRMTVIG